ncbi:hypothetical protein CDR86_02560 [Listeria monocytogenes]|uniref:hypothetical protein n=1 Tax=Listeria monocytogenes TaxID=1639 RepID=UPI000BE0EDC1|nr:hypothetical protein [Listeria monocytogenes]EAE3702077.1 hypothetical protein [Listeria monocytogenes serotype 1/2c]EAF3421688.1 hypothetical protein [Listeria monocytogenes]EBB5864993.1 hypothetical protein [Listeria monocytogenes]MCF2016130.1 hypothetical protein [Listeria monocytogenes]PDM04179.1 hypothetical protein CDR96_00395 [Listeria monocytogenes]
MENQILNLSAIASDVMLRNTADYVFRKMEELRSKKNDKQAVIELEQLINSLLEDKNELSGIIAKYEEEFVAQKLTQKDIDYITENLVPIINIIADSQDTEEEQEKIKQQMNLFKTFISHETFTIMQLIGYNFKRGLGEPLTEITKSAISGIVRKESEASSLEIQREIEIYKIIQDEQAYKRFIELNGQ